MNGREARKARPDPYLEWDITRLRRDAWRGTWLYFRDVTAMSHTEVMRTHQTAQGEQPAAEGLDGTDQKVSFL